jgi:hypothetical protein
VVVAGEPAAEEEEEEEEEENGEENGEEEEETRKETNRLHYYYSTPRCSTRCSTDDPLQAKSMLLLSWLLDSDAMRLCNALVGL